MKGPKVYPGPELQAPAVRDDVTRALPHAVGPEKSLLSSMLQDPQEFIGLAIELKLTAGHFYLPSHSTLFGFLVERFEAGQEIELVSMIQHLIDRGLLDRIGGPATLSDLYTYAPARGHFRYHLDQVKDKFVLRSIIENSNKHVAAAYDAPGDARELLDEVERDTMAIREGAENGVMESVKTDVERVIDNFQRRLKGEPDSRGIMTGFEDIDRMTNGLKDGNMFVVGARPSMGKTSFMMNVVEHICLHSELPTLVFSAEMGREEIVERMVFTRAKYPIGQMARGEKPTKGDLQRIQRAALEVSRAKLFINDSAGPTINFIRAVARRYKRDCGIRFIAIDYLQLLKSASKQAQGSREREIAEISAGIKGLAKDLGVPIMILAQLNREAEKRSGKSAGKPRMSDLRDSGSIEQDADIIGLLHRSAYYAETPEEKDATVGVAQLDLAKNRNGQTGIVPLTFIAELMRFETGAPVQEPADMFSTQQPKSRFDD